MLVFTLDTAQTLFRGGPVVPDVCRLTVGYQHMELHSSSPEITLCWSFNSSPTSSIRWTVVEIPLMDISVGDALSQLCQLLRALTLQLRMDAPFRDLI
ncbi:hypothetical protein GMD68_01230 [Pseudoflavonifractor sp. BIOML-A13]|nr:hypothetical protein [Pseudoflavonifractor sp. BIOML-A13]MTS90897.1 hypothetical protein [Pseudoflavonifractor sp. BIOML-A4]